SPGRKLYIAGIFVAVGFVLLLLLSRVVQRRSAQGSVAVTSSRVLQQKVSARLPEIPLSDRLAQEIAALDAVFAKQVNPSESVREAYTERRAELKDALADALASAPNGR
ncbi:MAG: hypothetical protein IT354_05840, partial [Gemmatimonadaceae bacterium]|nr:hypothetical protein [Gemmatimonadaceae bacterium]